MANAKFVKHKSYLFDRTVNQVWLEQGARRFEVKLRDKTAQMTNHQPASLPEDVLKEIERMAQHWE